MVTALHVKAPQSLQEQLTELSDPEGGRYTGPRIQDFYKGNGLQPAISHIKVMIHCFCFRWTTK